MIESIKMLAQAYELVGTEAEMGILVEHSSRTDTIWWVEIDEISRLGAFKCSLKRARNQ